MSSLPTHPFLTDWSTGVDILLGVGVVVGYVIFAFGVAHAINKLIDKWQRH